MEYPFDFEYCLKSIHFYIQVFNLDMKYISCEAIPKSSIHSPAFKDTYLAPILREFEFLCTPTTIPTNLYKEIIRKSLKDFLDVHNFFFSLPAETHSTKIEKIFETENIVENLKEDIKIANNINVSTIKFDGYIMGCLIYEIKHLNELVPDAGIPAILELLKALDKLQTALYNKGFIEINPYKDLTDLNPCLTLDTIFSCLPCMEKYLSYNNPSASLFENATQKLELKNLAKTNVSTAALALKRRKLI